MVAVFLLIVVAHEIIPVNQSFLVWKDKPVIRSIFFLDEEGNLISKKEIDKEQSDAILSGHEGLKLHATLLQKILPALWPDDYFQGKYFEIIYMKEKKNSFGGCVLYEDGTLKGSYTLWPFFSKSPELYQELYEYYRSLPDTEQ